MNGGGAITMDDGGGIAMDDGGAIGQRRMGNGRGDTTIKKMHVPWSLEMMAAVMASALR